MGACFSCLQSKHREHVIANCTDKIQKRLAATQSQINSLQRLCNGTQLKIEAALRDPENMRKPRDTNHPVWRLHMQHKSAKSRLRLAEDRHTALEQLMDGMAAADGTLTHTLQHTQALNTRTHTLTHTHTGSMDDTELSNIVAKLENAGVTVSTIETAAQGVQRAVDTMRDIHDAAASLPATSGFDPEAELNNLFLYGPEGHPTAPLGVAPALLLPSSRAAPDLEAQSTPPPRVSEMVALLGD